MANPRFALACLLAAGVGPACSGSSSGSGESFPELIAACSWPSAADTFNTNTGTGCSPRTMFEICQVPGGSVVTAAPQGDLVSIETPDGGVVSCSDYCSAAQYALSCHGAASPDSIPTIPSPAPALNCNVVPIPTPSTLLVYCCPCAP